MIDYQNPANWHPAAKMFPLMAQDELQRLADDIKINGQKNAIILLDDQILDGRNRALACHLAGVSPDFARLAKTVSSPAAWVLSQNLHRRHLTATQRAFVAVEAEKLFAVEAKQRQSEGAKVQAKLPEPVGQARAQAAKACDVSPRYVQDAKAVTEVSPKIAAQAKAGKISMASAKKATKKLARGDTAKMVNSYNKTAAILYRLLVNRAYDVGSVSWAAFRGMIRVNDRYKIVLYLHENEIRGLPRRAEIGEKSA